MQECYRVTPESILSWYTLRTSPNHHPQERNIKGIEDHVGSMAGTLEQLVEEKKNHNKNLANDKHKIFTFTRQLLWIEINIQKKGPVRLQHLWLE